MATFMGNQTDEEIANRFRTYEEFLDSQITPEDLYYLEDEEMARTLVEMGYRGSGAIMTRGEFLLKKIEVETESVQKKKKQTNEKLASQN